jgi:hypothetical protein
MNSVNTPTHPNASAAAAGCPFHAQPVAAPKKLQRHDYLALPMHQRVIPQYSTQLDGTVELHLYYGDKEISFDEPELFEFGEALAKHAMFRAESALTWGVGYTWAQISALLEQLLEQEVLHYAQPDHDAPVRDMSRIGARPSPLPTAPSPAARTWHECESITSELTGQAVELGHLELVIPVFRIAHMALDTEGRQVGEANVFPKAMRVEVPTKWRTCIYPGSRYMDSRPMNVSALKSMRAHWPQMMAALLQIREAYLQRFPRARAGWTLGDIECLSTLVLAVPTFQLMRETNRIENGDLHPVLSSLFRVTDGLRMTTHQMLFVPVAEATLNTQDHVSSAEIYAYAERNHAFASPHGVCAGPKVMIEEFLSVLIDGKHIDAVDDVVFDPQIKTALAELAQAFDYGLLGLQTHVAIFSLWPVMTRTYEKLANITRDWSGEKTLELVLFREHLQDKLAVLKNQTYHATEEWRVNRERVYSEIFEHCATGLGQFTQPGLRELISVPQGAEHFIVKTKLRALLRQRLCADPLECVAEIEAVLDCLMDFFVKAQSILVVACGVQSRINALLGRAQPAREFSAADIDIHVVLQGNEARRLPYLTNELESLLGFGVSVTRDAIVVSQK